MCPPPYSLPTHAGSQPACRGCAIPSCPHRCVSPSTLMCHGIHTPTPPPHATHSHATPLPPPLASRLSPPLPPGAVYVLPPLPSTRLSLDAHAPCSHRHPPCSQQSLSSHSIFKATWTEKGRLWFACCFPHHFSSLNDRHAVVITMSGGVDSSVAALTLAQEVPVPLHACVQC